jgi:hypothetical protein
MITTNSLLQAPRSIAEQLDALVVETFGSVRLVMPETGQSNLVAAAAWSHTFPRQHAGALLLDASPIASPIGEIGRTRLRCNGRAASYDFANHQSADIPLLGHLALADVVIVIGLNDLSPTIAIGLLRLVMRHVLPSSLVVAPVVSAHWLVRPLSLGGHVAFATDELIAPDTLLVHRSALIAASVMHRTNEANHDTPEGPTTP